MERSKEIDPTRGETELPNRLQPDGPHKWRDSNVITWQLHDKKDPERHRDAPDTHADSSSTDKMHEPSEALLNSESGRLFQQYLGDKKAGTNKLSPEQKAIFKIDAANFQQHESARLEDLLASITNTERTSPQVRQINDSVDYSVQYVNNYTPEAGGQAQRIVLERRRDIIKGTLKDKPFVGQRTVWEQYKEDLSRNSDHIPADVRQEETAWADLELELLDRREMREKARELTPEGRSKMWDKWYEDGNKMSKLTVAVERDRFIEAIESVNLEFADAHLASEGWIRSLHPDVRDQETNIMKNTFKEIWRDHKEQDPEPSEVLLNSESERLFKRYLFDRKIGTNKLSPERKANDRIKNTSFGQDEKSALYRLFDSIRPSQWTSPQMRRTYDSMDYLLRKLNSTQWDTEWSRGQAQRIVLERRRGIIKDTLKDKPLAEQRFVWEQCKKDLSRNSDHIPADVRQEETAWADLELELLSRKKIRDHIRKLTSDEKSNKQGEIARTDFESEILGKREKKAQRLAPEEISKIWDEWRKKGNDMSELAVRVERDRLIEQLERAKLKPTSERQLWEGWIESLHPDVRNQETEIMEKTIQEREEKYQQKKASAARATETMQASSLTRLG